MLSCFTALCCDKTADISERNTFIKEIPLYCLQECREAANWPY